MLSDDEKAQASSPWGPANPQALNRYAYVQNNPLRWTDPTGHSDCDPADSGPGGPCTIGGGGTPPPPPGGGPGWLARLRAWGQRAWQQLTGRGAGSQRAASISQPARGSRPLTAEDLGIKGSLQELRGTFSLNEGVATVRIDMIRGEITNPFQVVQNLSETARAAGATTLRIEGTLANERLYTVLVRRYAMRTEGGVDFIEIPLQ